MMNLRQPYSHRNVAIIASQAHHKSIVQPYKDINRMSQEMCKSLLQTRSMYGQKPMLVLHYEEPFVIEQEKLIHAMRTGNSEGFQALYRANYREAQVNELMYNLFVEGRYFTSQNFYPQLLFERDISGKTALHYAAAGGVDLTSPIVKQRIVSRFVRAEDYNGITALMISCFLGHTNNARLLMEAELEIRDAEGRSAIMHACAGRRVDTVVMLWRKSHKNVDGTGMTVEEYITKYGIREKVERMLRLQIGKQDKSHRFSVTGADNGRIDVISRMSDQPYISFKLE